MLLGNPWYAFHWLPADSLLNHCSPWLNMINNESLSVSTDYCYLLRLAVFKHHYWSINHKLQPWITHHVPSSLATGRGVLAGWGRPPRGPFREPALHGRRVHLQSGEDEIGAGGRPADAQRTTETETSADRQVDTSGEQCFFRVIDLEWLNNRGLCG